MKQTIAATLAVGLFALQGVAQDTKATLKDPKDKASYAIGTQIGTTLKRQKLDLNTDSLFSGIKDVLAGKDLQMTEQEMDAALEALQKEMMAKQSEAGAENQKKGEAFLAANKGKEGVITLPSGLQYKIVKEGTGKKPTRTDTVKAHYRGTLIDGTEFDSSYKRGEPIDFPVTGVIPGWTEALQLMPVGSKWQLFIPAKLGYGEGGAGPIPPNSTLIFDVELLGIEEAKK